MRFFNSNLTDNPIYTDSAGPWLYDRDNRAIFDNWLGAGTLIFGHCDEDLGFSIKALPDGMEISRKHEDILERLVDFRIGGIRFSNKWF